MKNCPYCGRPNEDDAIVCIKCWAGFPNEKQEEKSSEEPNATPRSTRKKIRS